MTYSLGREYTGQSTNTLAIVATEGTEDYFNFSISAPNAETSVTQDTLHPLTSQTITFSYADEGIYSANFEIKRPTGTPYLFEILSWEYDTEPPDPPIISFAKEATNKTSVNLLVSETRSSNTTDIWLAGDLDTSDQSEIEDEGYWQSISESAVAVPITLTSGDGLKTIDGKFRNIFGNVSEDAVPAEIILKQTLPTNCDAVPLSSTISNNKLTLKLSATDPYQTYYSVMGDIKSVIDENAFEDQENVYIYLESSPGQKDVTVFIEDIAGNICLEKDLTITIDPDFESEGIWVEDATYWTDSEDIVVDVFFDHFEDQEPLQIKITGDVSGLNTNSWIDYEQDLPITLNPSTEGSRKIYAQYRDVDGNESYYLSKRIYLKPSITLQDAGAPMKDVIVSNILDATSITITGCKETYNEVAYAASYTCEPDAATVDVTYKFPDDTTLTKSAVP